MLKTSNYVVLYPHEIAKGLIFGGSGMRKITGYDIIETIDRLPKNRVYNYVSLQTKGVIKIVEVRRPGGPIRFKRWIRIREKMKAELKLKIYPVK